MSTSATPGSGKKPKGAASSGWFTCSKCEKKFPRGASGKHADAGCGDEMYPYILKGFVHAVLINATTASKIQNLPLVKCCRLSSSTIFIPEELIKEAGLQTFGWVLVKLLLGQENAVAMRVWPTPDSIGATSASGNVMMTKDGFLANNITPSAGESIFVQIQPLRQGVIAPARSITIEVNIAEANIDTETFDPQRFIVSFKKWVTGRMVFIGNVFRIRYYAEIVTCKVIKCDGERMGSVSEMENRFQSMSLESTANSFQITDATDVNVSYLPESEKRTTQEKRLEMKLADIGGLDSVISELVASVNFIMDANAMAMTKAKGVLLYGHSGTGKTVLIHALCDHFNLTPVIYNEFSTADKKSNTLPGSNSLAKIFQEAISKSPSAIIIENLDSLAPSKSSSSTSEQVSSNFALSFQSLMPSLRQKSKIIIVASATDADSVDSGLRSPQIFGKEVELPVPSRKDRGEILDKMFTKFQHSLSPQDISDIAAATHGFVGADLHGLCTHAIQLSLQKCSEGTAVSMEDVATSLKTTKPSAVKSILVDVPNVRWDDIGGQDDLKFKLKQAIEWPLKNPEAFKRLGITPPKGVLMYGPPGCSKTMIAKAIATESGLNFISVKGSDLFSKWVGESEKAVRKVFRKARQVAPCVVFFDEIDSLGGERGGSSGSSNVHERVLAQLLVELDGIEPLKDVTIVAATNRPDIIDQALLRPGRLDRIIYVPLPDAATRREILRLRFKKMPIHDSVQIEKIVEVTEGYSGAEMTALCQEGALKALEESITAEFVMERHILQALDIIKPRIGKDQIKFYDEYSQHHKRL